jgi:hypothetical protein
VRQSKLDTHFHSAVLDQIEPNVCHLFEKYVCITAVFFQGESESPRNAGVAADGIGMRPALGKIQYKMGQVPTRPKTPSAQLEALIASAESTIYVKM